MSRLLLVTILLLVFAPGASAMRWLDDPPADTTPPVITIAGPTTAEASSSSGADVQYNPSATDETAPPSPTVTCSPPPGMFGIGTTPVHCSAFDAAGNEGVADFNVVGID